MNYQSIKRITALILSCSLLFCGTACGGQNAPEGESKGPEPSQQNESGEAMTIEENRIILGDEAYGSIETPAKVIVANTEKNTVNPLIFGDNLSWRGNGYGMWDEEAGAPQEQLLEMLKESGITHLRYPGGIEGDYFHWDESVGDVDSRLPQIDPFSKDYPTYGMKDGESYVATFGPDEFQKLVEAADIKATIQLNAGNGTPQEAADWVRYCIDQELDVATFAVGNEVHFAEERVEGMTVTKTPQEYIDFYNAVWEALGDTADDITLGCIGVPASHPLNKYRNWDAQVLSALSDKVDFIDIHIGYTPYLSTGESTQAAAENYLAASVWIQELIETEKQTIQDAAGDRYDDIDIQITEYGPIGGSYPNSLAGAIFLASFFNVVLAEPKITAANHLPMINHYDAPNLLGSLLDLSVTGEEAYWDNIQTHVFRMYSAQSGRQVLDTQVEAPGTFSCQKVGLVPAVSGVPNGEASVYYDPETKNGSIFLINKSTDENMTFEIDLPFSQVSLGKTQELWNQNPAAKNNWSNPETVAPVTYDTETAVPADGAFQIQTKPVSLVKVDFTVTG